MLHMIGIQMLMIFPLSLVKLKKLFEESDYVVGNFETVCAGDKNGFQNQYLLCNSPDELIQAMVKGGVNCVTTANNHCLDQGIEGLVRTIKELDRNKVFTYGYFLHMRTLQNEFCIYI